MAALRPMCGSTAARAMVALSQTTESLMSDVQLRHMLEIDPEADLGPVFAAISRGVKRSGLGRDDVLVRRMKRGTRGKLHYWFGLTPLGMAAVEAIGSFEEEPDFTVHR